jgi:hypothetical protein
MFAYLKAAREKRLEQKGIKPLALQKFLAENPDASPPIKSSRTGIAARTVIAWYQWSNTSWGLSSQPTGWLKGWRMEGDRYQPCQQHVQALSSLVKESVISNWTTEIQQIGGFSASKSKLEELESMDIMATRNSPEMIDEITEAKLQRNLAHDQIRIINSPDTTSDCFVRFGWDDLTYLFNAGGSHHFAAARYIAGKLGIEVPLNGKLVTFDIDRDSVIALRQEFEMFTIKKTMLLDLFDAMRLFGAPLLHQALPMPHYHDICAVFLPRKNDRSMRVAEQLHAAGWTDLGEHLAELTLAAG